MSEKIRVLVVDDQEIIRKILVRELNATGEIDVIAVASDAYEARDKIIECNPDVMTLDIEMPRMNGLEFLRRLIPQHPIPVIMLSSISKEGQTTALESLASGAVDFVTKPDGSDESLERTIQKLKEKIIIASRVDVKKLLVRKFIAQKKSGIVKQNTSPVKTLIAIGASTGGTTALFEILSQLPEKMPPILIVQHMPKGFTKLFAERMNTLCNMEVVEATDGVEVNNGKVYIAPGDSHLTLLDMNGKYNIKLLNTDKVCSHRPSVNVLFSSIADLSVCKNSIGIILTGMGKDGADGLKKMRNKGAFTIGQDEISSVVYGMPREAFLNGAVQKQIELSKIPSLILSILKEIQFIKT